MKTPAFQFYPGDWLRDLALRSCSVPARGLWIDLLALAWDGSPRGYCRVGDRPLSVEEIARLVGSQPRQVRRWIDELVMRGVCSIDADGSLYSRRMLRDEEIRTKRAAGGHLGGNPALMGGAEGRKDNRKVGSEDNLGSNLAPTPSSAPASAPASASSSGLPRDSQDSLSSGLQSGAEAVPEERASVGYALAEFEELWELYPRQEGEIPARHAYVASEKAPGKLRRPPHSELMEALRSQMAAREASFFPSLEKWLREGRWNDKYAPKRSAVPQFGITPSLAPAVTLEGETAKSLRAGKATAALIGLAHAVACDNCQQSRGSPWRDRFGVRVGDEWRPRDPFELDLEDVRWIHDLITTPAEAGEARTS